jgi:hypothetical protein
MRVSCVAILTVVVATGFLRAQCGVPIRLEPQTIRRGGPAWINPYCLMNATKDRIWVDIDSPRDHDWRNAPLYPSQSAVFIGALVHVKVRLRSGRVLEYDARQIAGIQTRAPFQRGDWLFDGSSLRFVSCEERQKLYQALKKYEWTTKP